MTSAGVEIAFSRHEVHQNQCRMRTIKRMTIFLASGVLCAQPYAQVLRNAEHDPGQMPYSDVRSQPTPELENTIEQMLELVRELQQGDLSPAQQQAALDELIRDREYILHQHNTWLDWQKPQTVDSAALLLEKMIFEEATDIAPTVQSRQQVLRNAPQRLDLDPNQPQYEPPLLDSVKAAEESVATSPQSTSPVSAADTTGVAEDSQPVPTPLPAASSEYKDKKARQVSVSKNVKVAVLADDRTTIDMHADDTILRDVKDQKGEQVLFGRIHLWAGGAVQLDAYLGDGLFTIDEDGDTDSKSYIRRGEGIIRASVMENGEIKVQYDFDTREFRDLAWRWLSKSRARSLTIGNQKEPIGLDYLVGSKFTTAMEPSAPSSAFGSYRSAGIRYNGWATLESEDQLLHLGGDNRTHVTTSVGLFGEDIENTNDTDWAITGRISVGSRQTEKKGFHLAVASSYRHGEFDSIAPRPGLQDVNRITLAQPQADTQALLALEGMVASGSLYSQVELYYSDYSGGAVDAQGWGGYGQVGWLFGGQQRIYHPKWGIWGPIYTGNKQFFEIFGRASYTRGNDDVNSSNEMALLTLGGNWYYNQFRVSTNLIFADTARDISGESRGNVLALRLQYLF
jgi:phosphate-selective porin